MNSLQTDTYRIQASDTDFNQTARLTSLCSFFQESAWKHAHIMGLGWSHLDERGELWVLSRLSLRISRLPKWRDLVTLSTWARGTEKLFALRDFTVTGENGEAYAAGSSSWLVIDAESRRPQRIAQAADRMFFHTERALGSSAERLVFSEPGTMVRSYQVGYSDIDMNNHVNNVTYIRWVIDSFELEFLRNRRILDFSINFLSEALYGDEITVTHAPPAEVGGPFQIRLFGSGGTQETARASVRFDPERPSAADI